MIPQVHQMTNQQMIDVLKAVSSGDPRKIIYWQNKFGMTDIERVWHKMPHPIDKDTCLNFCAYNYKVEEEHIWHTGEELPRIHRKDEFSVNPNCSVTVCGPDGVPDVYYDFEKDSWYVIFDFLNDRFEQIDPPSKWHYDKE